MRRLWINPAVFSWPFLPVTATLRAKDAFLRPFQFCARADALLESAADEFARSDSVANLKRAVNIRLRQLEDIYRFSNINLHPRASGALERLAAFGIVRPFLLRHLLDIRNNIEHKDHSPPSSRRCRELADITWYFLRSTDALLTSVATCWQLQDRSMSDDQSEPWLELTVRWKPTLRLTTRAWLAPEHHSPQEVASFVPLRITRAVSPIDPRIPAFMRRGREDQIHVHGVLPVDDRTILGVITRLLA